MNVFTFTGNLGRDAEVRYTQGGDAVSGFSVAVKSGFGKNEKTIWVKCSQWGKAAESVAPYLKKGQQVAISGEIGFDADEKNDGKYAAITVRVNSLTLGGGKSEGERADPAKSRQKQTSAPSKSEDVAEHFGDGDYVDVPF